MKKFKNILYYIVLGVLIILVAAVLTGRYKGMQAFTVLTGSMEPELPVGSVIITVPADINSLSVGDDISFVRDESLTVITHRVVEIDKASEQVTTRGIANNVTDSPSRIDNVLGKVIFCIPRAGYLAVYFADTRVKTISMIILIAAVFILIIKPMGKEKKK